MLEGGQARVRQQLREEVEKAGNGLVSIQQELKELRNEREKRPELEPGAEIAAPPSETRIEEAGGHRVDLATHSAGSAGHTSGPEKRRSYPPCS